MEIAKNQEDLKEPPKKEKDTDQFMLRWRNSEFYRFVIKILNDELETSYLRDVMTARILNGEPMDDQEISTEMRTEVKSNLRIKKIKEILE